MNASELEVDVVVVGSGIAGAALAMVLSRVGARVLVVEQGKHPRFAIGESAVPAATATWVELARRYEVPDLLSFTSYVGLKEAGLTGYPKAHFYFAYHQPDQALDPAEQLMFETFPLPVGPDVHMLRSDVDAHLVARLPAYGVEYREQTTVGELHHDAETGRARLALEGPDGRREVRCALVFDATGHAGTFGRMLGLRDPEPRLHTNTRVLFGHFRDVAWLEDILPPAPKYRYARDAGTMHHMFPGGWIWIIPFDDGVTSVGIVLDRERFPLDPSVAPEDEWAAHIARYPTVSAHLGPARAIRPLVRTDRVQFSSRGIIAPGVVLTPHAAGFIDPLFSTGLTLTASFIARAAEVVRRGLAEGDLDTRRFEGVERAFLSEVRAIDLVVSGTIRACDDYELLRQYWLNWIQSTNMEVFGRLLADHTDPESAARIFGSAAPWWMAQLERRHAVVYDARLPALERAYRIEPPRPPSGGLLRQLRWCRAQLRRGGLGLWTLRRVARRLGLWLARGLFGPLLEAEGPLAGYLDYAVHDPGPVLVAVYDPTRDAFDYRDPAFDGFFRRVLADMGSAGDPRRERAVEHRERHRALRRAWDAAQASGEPPVVGAALEALEERLAGRPRPWVAPVGAPPAPVGDPPLVAQGAP